MKYYFNGYYKPSGFAISGHTVLGYKYYSNSGFTYNQNTILTDINSYNAGLMLNLHYRQKIYKGLGLNIEAGYGYERNYSSGHYYNERSEKVNFENLKSGNWKPSFNFGIGLNYRFSK